MSYSVTANLLTTGLLYDDDADDDDDDDDECCFLKTNLLYTFFSVASCILSCSPLMAPLIF